MTGLVALSGSARLIGLFSGVLGYVAVAAAAGGATFWITSRGYETELANVRAERANNAAVLASATLAQFISDSKIVADAARTFQASQASYQQGLADINAAFKAASSKNPLPAGCKPDAARMRALADAIAAANTATGAGGKSGRALPGPVSPRSR